MSAVRPLHVDRVDVALYHVRKSLDELARVPDQDDVFEAQRGLLVALTALLRMQQGIVVTG